MVKKITAYILSICIAAVYLLSFPMTVSAAEAYGEYIDGWYHISTAEQLKALADASKAEGSPVLTAKFVLDNDIVLSASYDKSIWISSSSSVPFKGTFDGNGHTIRGLSYSTQSTNTALFGYTNGAVIKDLVIDGANIKVINRGGILAGAATNTDFVNITIKNSRFNIASGGEVIELITADGVTGGALVGEAVDGCRIYNCETINTVVDTGNVEGVSALGGDGYYIGGLVGTLSASHIEYCRVLSEGAVDSGQVGLEITVVLAALSYKSVNIGGLVGEMKSGATVTDSYCNAYLNAWPSMALGLVAVTYGYLGGIAGAVHGDSCKITRCHYSGKARERSYEASVLAATPAKVNDHLGGIIGRIGNAGDTYYNSADTRFVNCYYNYDRMMDNLDGVSPGSAVAWRIQSASIYKSVIPSTCASYTNTQYEDQSNWSSNDFDFSGNIQRSTNCDDLVGGQHVNQWVMKTITYNSTDGSTFTTTMPVHGNTSFKVFSNLNNAFEDANPVSMDYTYRINEDNTITLPSESDLNSIVPESLNNRGFIGIALVSKRTGEDGNTIYTCDGIYEAGANVSSDLLNSYINSDEPDKIVYGVWCQSYTLGAQIGLNNNNQGLRTVVAVNTALLENIGLLEPDIDYGRGTTFTVDNKEYIIEADSGLTGSSTDSWRGESYISGSTYNGIRISDYVKDARVFSIFMALDDESLSKEITYQGDILYYGTNPDGTKLVLDYLCNGKATNSASNIAKSYINDLEASGKSADNYYGLDEETYNNLVKYIA